uniref:Uncharacterized protein n=1 Tax=Talaromyces marneffei PM1 TaxID=1077442 RepID=A0A093X6S3_TALMA
MPPVNMRRITSLKSLIPAAFAPGSGFTNPNHDDLHEGVTCPVLPSPRSLTEASSPPGPRCRAEEMVPPRQEAIDGFLLFGHLHEAPQERVCPDVEEWRILDARGTLLYSQDRCHNRSVQTRYLNGEAREWVDSSSQRFCGRPGFVEEALRWMMEGTIVVLDLPKLIWISPCPSWLTTIAPEWVESMNMNRAFFTHTASILATAAFLAKSTGMADFGVEGSAMYAADALLRDGVPIDAWQPLRLLQPAVPPNAGAHTLLTSVIIQILQRQVRLTWSEPSRIGAIDRIRLHGRKIRSTRPVVSRQVSTVTIGRPAIAPPSPSMEWGTSLMLDIAENGRSQPTRNGIYVPLTALTSHVGTDTHQRQPVTSPSVISCISSCPTPSGSASTSPPEGQRVAIVGGIVVGCLLLAIPLVWCARKFYLRHRRIGIIELTQLGHRKTSHFSWS